ncbi:MULTISPECIES: hypothetical protein [unclassified Paenibacillus]|uniref:hypothetical protein n=1 Tax=unclassified Paenibacillus TaxID=185978 RepID=UPI0024B93ECA|nr:MULTISPECIES: hypothetical protein [unclassified Paenibacillus]
MNRVWTKASAILLVVVSLLFNGTYALAASASTYVVTFQQATLVSNDHVGNDWAIAAEVGGQIS